jgi:hypothetical protein
VPVSGVDAWVFGIAFGDHGDVVVAAGCFEDYVLVIS